MIKETKGQILGVTIQNPVLYDYDDIIFQVEVHNIEEGWNAQLMFKSNQIIDIMKEFDVRFIHEIALLDCYLLEDTDMGPASVPIGLTHEKDGKYIEVHNEYFSTLWK